VYKRQGLPLEPPGGAEPGERPTDLEGLIARANALWQEAQEALRAGNWAGYGAAIEELGRVLRELSSLTGAEVPEPEAIVPEAS